MSGLPIPLGPPLPPRSVVAVLLADGEEMTELERCFRNTQWPKGVQPMIPEAEDRDAIVKWFGILKFPCVAVVVDGMLLGVEHACTDEACARLAEHAKQCHRMPLEV